MQLPASLLNSNHPFFAFFVCSVWKTHNIGPSHVDTHISLFCQSHLSRDVLSEPSCPSAFSPFLSPPAPSLTPSIPPFILSVSSCSLSCHIMLGGEPGVLSGQEKIKRV